jgi:hypothetical protein
MHLYLYAYILYLYVYMYMYIYFIYKCIYISTGFINLNISTKIQFGMHIEFINNAYFKLIVIGQNV